MKAFRQLNTSNWAVCLLSASLIAVAVSTWQRPVVVSAQATKSPARKATSSESKAVLNALQDAFVNIADSVEPSVVTILARPNVDERASAPKEPDDSIPEPFRDFFRRMPRPDGEGGGGGGTATGSGVIIRESGSTVYVLTNNHVVDNRAKFRITLYDKSEYLGELVGRDEKTDLAVLKFQTKRPLPAGSLASIGDSDRVRVGQWAIAIGSPLGYDSTLTVGVVSAKGRELDGFGRGASYVDLIQTDASINPGNSGGPLVNIDGDVIGINVAIASNGMSQGNIGIGFAIPANTAKMVSEQLIERGKVTRGYLGVAVSPANRILSLELRDHLKTPTGGALCETVQPDTPAGRAGLKDGDVIVKFGDREVHSFTDLEKAVSVTRPGNTVPVEVIRDGRPVRLSITVTERPAEKDLSARLKGDTSVSPEAPADKPIRSRYGISIKPAEGGKGVSVASVTPGSPASDAGLRPGDVILQIGDTATPSVDVFQKTINAVGANEGVVLRVRTPAGLRFVVVKP